MPDMVSDEWVGKTSWRFRELYMRALRELTSQLKSQKRYAELLEDCELVVSYRITCNNGNQRTLINP